LPLKSPSFPRNSVEFWTSMITNQFSILRLTAFSHSWVAHWTIYGSFLLSPNHRGSFPWFRDRISGITFPCHFENIEWKRCSPGWQFNEMWSAAFQKIWLPRERSATRIKGTSRHRNEPLRIDPIGRS
jgi:hypothetical protein